MVGRQCSPLRCSPAVAVVCLLFVCLSQRAACRPLAARSVVGAAAPASWRASGPGRSALQVAHPDPVPAVHATAGQLAEAEQLADVGLTPAAAFALHSRPESGRKIALDFRGHVTVGTLWNSHMQQERIVSPAYDSDGDPEHWSARELSDIKAIWEAVSEDFAIFDVDVTTAELSDAALEGVGVRVVVGGSFTDWYRERAGGVAAVGSFGTAPCFVFSQNLGPSYAKYVWEEVSHEVGHTLGLQHAGTVAQPGAAASQYFAGHGAWAPLMGSAYFRSVTTWDRGEFFGSSKSQDDVAVIAQRLPLLRQPHGSSASTATPLVLAAPSGGSGSGGATARAPGLVTQPGAANYFSLAVPAAGSLAVAVAVAAPWGSQNRANLDALVRVLDASGAVLAELDPPGLGVESTSVALPERGTYFVAVAGTGAGDPALTGYSAYGSRGRFTLTAIFTAGAPAAGGAAQQAGKAAPQAQALPAAGGSSAGQALLRVDGIRLSKVFLDASRATVSCTATVTVKAAAGAPLTGVALAATWSLDAPADGAPPAGATVSTATTGAGGIAALRSGPMPATHGHGCALEIKDAYLAGYGPLVTPQGGLKKTIAW